MIIVTDKRLKKIIDLLEQNELDLKSFGNFMHDYSLSTCDFGTHTLDKIKNVNGDEMGLAWIRRTYGFGLKRFDIETMMNEYLWMKQEIEKLKVKLKKYELQPK